MTHSGGEPHSAGGYARLDNGVLIVGNDLIERRWSVAGGVLRAQSLADRSSGREWAAGPAELASLTPPAAAGASTAPPVEPPAEPPVEPPAEPPVEPPAEPSLRVRRGQLGRTSDPALMAELALGDRGRVGRFVVFDDVAAVGMQMAAGAAGRSASAASATAGPAGGEATGVEATGPHAAPVDPADVIDAFDIDPLHCRLLLTRFVEQTDHHHNVVFDQWWSLHPSEKRIAAPGNLFYLEHRPTQSGLALLKIAPSPDNRFPPSEVDIEVRGGQVATRGHGGAAEGYLQWAVAYHGGRVGRIAAIQALQRRLRPYREGRDGLLLSNNWGDRSQDSRLNEPFVRAEIAAAPEAGIDVLQLDDGWQKGVTSNSTQDVGQGVWSGYWAVDPDFWTPRPAGFPAGLAPIVAASQDAGLKLGLWYSPDSSHEFANWEKDAEQLAALTADYGVRHVKIDGVKLSSRRAEARLQAMFDRVLERAGSDVTLDADVTAQVRLGFWGAPHAGPLFVENRYTDWHNYWPHQTLRTIWRLAHHINPMRLRMEFLNPYRNEGQYADDPLAPSRYSPAALFATVMMTSPLAWFELSNAPAPFRRQVGGLARIWKAHRAAIFTSAVIPIGGEPDGHTWTGFCTWPETEDEAMRAVVYRPLGAETQWSFDLPRPAAGPAEWLAGPGRAAVHGDRVQVEVDEALGYGFLRVP